MKFRCLAEPAFVVVEAETAYEAQNQAFARYILALSPSKISAEPVRAEEPEWMEER